MATKTLYDWFGHTVLRYGDRPALEIDDEVFTYDELERLVGQLARHIERTLGRRPTRVGLLTSRSVVTYVGYLAVLRLGAVVVPMNPRTPAARNLVITADAAVDATIVDDSSGYWRKEYVEKAGTPIIDMTGERWRRLPTEDTGSRIEPRAIDPANDFAYIVFTSGSTGRPKGVPITHASVSAFLTQSIPLFEFGPDSRVSQTFELSFDAAVNELFGPWGSGGTVCVPTHRDVFDPVSFVNMHSLTHWLTVSSIVSFLKREGKLDKLSMPTLRHSLLGGEPTTTEQAKAWLDAAPNARVHNCYGPTELTLLCAGYIIERDEAAWPITSNGTIPIGQVYPSLEYLLLDEDMRATRDGELCVRGPQRFPGYLDPANNIGQFVSYDGTVGTPYTGDVPLTDEFYYRTGDRVREKDGLLVHLGRVDTQIKIHGFRIELGEVEAVLRKHPHVGDVVVVASTADDGQTDLEAVYTGARTDTAELAALAADLPLYMRPRRYHLLDKLPMNANGKLDRDRLARELPKPSRHRKSQVSADG